MVHDEPARSRSRVSRLALAGAAVAVALAGVLVWVAAGTPGVGDGAGPARVRELSPEAFAARLDEAALVVNVHVPYEGEIEATDAFIPFDRIAGDARLPRDRSSEILLYCRTGSMSARAARTLVAEGYTNVAHLAGGMVAWEADGRPLVRR